MSVSRPRSSETLKESTMPDIELSDGGVIEAPEDNGTIRRRDVHGNLMDVRSIGDEGWDEWAHLFDVTEENFKREDDDA